MRQGLRFPFANSAALWGITGALVLLYISDLTFISDLIFFFCSFLLLSYPASRLWACGRWWANLPMDCECTSLSSQRCVGHGVCIKQVSQKMSHRGTMCFKRWLLELPPQSLTEKTETAGDFPGGPVVETLPSSAGVAGWFPGQGIWSLLPQVWPKIKNK